ncbi:hypothetical protein ACFFGH_30355 [Lysobacter korlensis]|uniref:Uncharacterized protein n=1 Tax=Lysobacter korlensis TaxID=553636 RepID=A0ABV6RYV5_9GAMM
MDDSGRVSDQAALTTSSGRSWLIVGGILAALSIGFLFGMRDLNPPGVATAGLVAVIALYLGMVAVRFGVGRLRLRLGLLAALTIAICLAFVLCALVIASTEWSAVVA